jgi:hypothetical protein
MPRSYPPLCAIRELTSGDFFFERRPPVYFLPAIDAYHIIEVYRTRGGRISAATKAVPPQGGGAKPRASER